MIKKRGSSREVYLFGPLAVKIPLNRWGREDNKVERNLWNKTKDNRLCPLICCLFGGMISVYRRAEPISNTRWEELISEYIELEDWPAGDVDQQNMGILNGRIVMVDYAEEIDLYD